MTCKNQRIVPLTAPSIGQINSPAIALRHLEDNGYIVDSQVERALRDAVASTVYAGTSEIQRNMIARWLGP